MLITKCSKDLHRHVNFTETENRTCYQKHKYMTWAVKIVLSLLVVVGIVVGWYTNNIPKGKYTYNYKFI